MDMTLALDKRSLTKTRWIACVRPRVGRASSAPRKSQIVVPSGSAILSAGSGAGVGQVSKAGAKVGQGVEVAVGEEVSVGLAVGNMAPASSTPG